MTSKLLRTMAVLSVLAAISSRTRACIPPVEAVITGPAWDPHWLHVGYEDCFDGSDSWALYGISHWIWDFGDGSPPDGHDGHPPDCDGDGYEVRHEYSTVGTYEPNLYVEDFIYDHNNADLTLYVVDWGLIVQPGYTNKVALNNDDDNENGTMDKKFPQEQQVDNEDDLVPIVLTVNTEKSSDDVHLKVQSGMSRIKIWRHANKRILEIPDPNNNNADWKRWSAGSCPLTLYVEGIAQSAEDAVKLKMSYVAIPPVGRGPERSVPRNPDVPDALLKFTVLEVDMDMAGVLDDDSSELTEEIIPGGFVGLGDRVHVQLKKVQPETLEGTVKLDVIAGGSKVEVQDEQGNPISLPAYYATPDDLPEDVWVKGVSTSSSLRDITLELAYGTFHDRINVTVVEVDLDISGVADAVEVSPGGFVALNDDDNNWNGTPDKDDPKPVTDEDDLVQITLHKVLPEDLTGEVTLEAIVGGSKIKLWDDQDNLVSLPETYNTPADLPKHLWVEGLYSSSSLGDVELKMTCEYDGRDVGDDTVCLTVIDVDITEPDGSLDAGRNPSSSWESSPCYHFDFQGITSGEPGSYALAISGAISPSLFTYQWSLASSCGTLSSTTVPSPTHTEPASPGEGILELEAVYSGTPTEIVEERKPKIYQDHLARDYANFGTGGSCVNNWKVTTFNVNPQPVMANWNCHGSTNHACSGYGSGSSGGLSSELMSWSQNPFNAPINWSNVQALLDRGDVVAYYAGSSLQHSATCINSTTTWGANNDPVSGPETWKWYLASPQDWWNNAGTNNPPFPDCTKIIIYNKP